MLSSAEFEAFLGKIDLQTYRSKYNSIKIVEMDLHKSIQAIALLYEVYWQRQELLGYDAFYNEYHTRYSSQIDEFQKKTQMCASCFALGLPARIYRTWASIITQIHGGYVAQDVFGASTVSMSEELDRAGADFRVVYKGKAYNFQVKKQSMSREVRQQKTSTKKLDGAYENLFYNVPPPDVFNNPFKKDGAYKKPYLDFGNNSTLKRLNNGFVVFTPGAFTRYKDAVDAAHTGDQS